MQPIKCTKCGMTLAGGKDTEGDITTVRIVCVCGNINLQTYIGYPRLCGTDEIYFDFTDEFEITCHKR